MTYNSLLVNTRVFSDQTIAIFHLQTFNNMLFPIALFRNNTSFINLPTLFVLLLFIKYIFFSYFDKNNYIVMYIF